MRSSSNGMLKCAPSGQASSSTRDLACTVRFWGGGCSGADVVMAIKRKTSARLCPHPVPAPPAASYVPLRSAQL